MRPDGVRVSMIWGRDGRAGLGFTMRIWFISALLFCSDFLYVFLYPESSCGPLRTCA
jgi:hypothetical protein